MSDNWNYNPLHETGWKSSPLHASKGHILSDPITFFNNNIVMVPIEGGTGGVRTMSLAPSPRHSCHNPRGMPVYELSMEPGGGPSSFRAYWLPYRTGEAHCIKLGDGADLMFTTTMDGCTFAAGGDKSGPLVSHTNLQKTVLGEKKVDPARIDQEVMRIHRWETTYVQINKPDYQFATDSFAGQGGKITTFGVRDPASNQWEFWIQKRQLFEPAASLTAWEFVCLIKAA